LKAQVNYFVVFGIASIFDAFAVGVVRKLGSSV
jgi:hypothetical protein